MKSFKLGVWVLLTHMTAALFAAPVRDKITKNYRRYEIYMQNESLGILLSRTSSVLAVGLLVPHVNKLSQILVVVVWKYESSHVMSS
jgi:hypothetical protein